MSRSFTRGLVRIAAALLLGSLSACAAGAAQTPVQAPPPAVEPRTEAQPAERRDRPPKLIAPPPAYGNRVVMARAPGQAGRF